MAQSKSKRKRKTTQNTRFNLQKAVLANKQRLIELCEGVGSNITAKFTKNDYIQIYISTIQHSDVKCHPDHDISSKIVASFKKSVKTMLYTKLHNTIKPSNIKISLRDICIIEGLMSYIERHIKTDESTKKELEKDIKYLEEYFSTRDKQLLLINYVLLDFQQSLTIPSRKMYTLHFVIPAVANYKKCSVCTFYHLKKHEPVKEYININNHWRPVYKVQQPDFEIKTDDVVIKDCKINASLLSDVYKGSNDELPVYIQSHALDRICERLYPLNIILINQLILKNLFTNPKIQYFNKRILIEINMKLGKMGYFLAEIIDEKIILKTFLLISNNSTPEGILFKQLTGFSKSDVDYWDLDSLPTFVNNDMDKNNHLYTFFEQAGLLHLFKLSPEAIKYDNPEYDYAAEINWDKMEHYINDTTDREALSDEELDCVNFNAMLK